MDKRLTLKVKNHNLTMKNSIKEWLKEKDIKLIDKDDNDCISEFMSFVYDYKNLEITKEDMVKRKRTKNIIPSYERCCAKKDNGEQCTRRKKCDTDFCGTHCNGNPNGTVNIKTKNFKTFEVWSEEFDNGIYYFIDIDNNVYKHQDIQNQKENPEIIGKWYKNENDKYCLQIK